MNELIQINYDSVRPTVSARDLHACLGITDRFSRWFERMQAYGFDENIDFTSVKSSTLVHNGAEREITDYQISVDMAKQICMLQRSEKGRTYRQYFIDLEKAWNTPEQVMARALKIADQKITSLKEDNAALLEDNRRMKPKEVFADAVSASKTSILIGDLAKMIRQNGYEIGQRRLFEWLRGNGYLIKRKGSDWNMPTQRSMEMQLFEIKESTHLDGNGCNVTTRTPKVTGKGQVYFVNKFLGKVGEPNENDKI